MYSGKPFLEPYFDTTSPLKFQAFISALQQFREQEQLPNIQDSLAFLEKSFSQELRIQHPRDIYPIYEALTFTTNEVAKKSLSDLSNSWEEVLAALNHRQVYRIGLGSTSFDTSIAQGILTRKLDELQKSIVVAPIDLKDEHNLRKVADYILRSDNEAFGACFQRGFIEEILRSDAVRCLVASNKENEIIGIVWGFLTDEQNFQLFHFWELSRKASMANMGIARQLIHCAKQQQHLYPNLKFATLNVDADNAHAREIYDQENFAALSEAQEGEKIFMSNKLNPPSDDDLESETPKTIVKKFVLNTIPLYKLIYYELARRCELIWRFCWYR